MRLNASIDVARFLLRSGFPFCGHYESEESEYKGGFLELLEWHGDRNPDVGRVILRHAPQNDMMICPTIQKEIVEACAKEATKAIILEDMKRDCPYHLDRFAAENLLSQIQEFGFMFKLHLMFRVLLLTNEWNNTLQKKDKDIVNAIGMLDLAKERLQMMRKTEWNSLLDEVSSFCSKHDILIPKMDEDYTLGKSKRKRYEVSYLHHFRVEVFTTVIDLEFQELNDRFNVVTTDLLLGMASLNQVDSFANFDKDKIMKLAECYLSEFGDNKLRELGFQLDSFIVYAQKCDSRFLNLKELRILLE
ncbi:PREDICTED: uncharacterized protein LOC109211037 [Nicotiana attenuata]|uniref:uncharacterized protein LOC109211037 n=1 Tax=Nicotiana attenuata TaxID=49451 RepID=UPI000904E493|nr:PREDICTED: uncharacterized protein LOC109211037 [Nicotiana attenuata]